MAIWKSHTGSGDHLSLVSFVGVAVWAVGLTCEHVADMQKTLWNAKNKSGKQKEWITTGIWYYSRHPNFLGENVNQFGI